MDLDTTSFSTRVRIQKYDDALVVSLHGDTTSPAHLSYVSGSPTPEAPAAVSSSI
jgi:hypothetical protein